MAKLTITNISGSDLHLGDFYLTIPAGASRDVDRAANDISGLPTLQKALADGAATLSVQYTADELASGLLSLPDAVQAEDMAPVAASALPSPAVLLRASIPAGAGGAPDDVALFAVGAVPWKFRILDAWAFVSAGNGVGEAIQLRTALAGGGTLLSTLDATNTGRISGAATATGLVTPGGSVGLIARRSDSAIAAEVCLIVRREELYSPQEPLRNEDPWPAPRTKTSCVTCASS